MHSVCLWREREKETDKFTEQVNTYILFASLFTLALAVHKQTGY